MARLHAPKDGEYRKHLYEGHTLCHKLAWIANGPDRITCTHCHNKVHKEHDEAQGFLEVVEDIG